MHTKKAIRFTVILAILGAIAAIAGAYISGMEAGKHKLLDEATFFIVDYDAPVEFCGEVYDTSLFIDVDGNVYEQGLYIC